MKAIICDVCGKVMREKDYSEYDVASVGQSFVPYDICMECRDNIRNYINSLSKERKGE